MVIDDIFDETTADDEKEYKDIPKQFLKEVNAECRKALYAGEPACLTPKQSKLLYERATKIIPVKTQVGCLAFAVGSFCFALVCVIPMLVWTYLIQKGYTRVGSITLPWLALLIFLALLAGFVVLCLGFSKRQKKTHGGKRAELEDILRNKRYRVFTYPVDRVVRINKEPPYEPEIEATIWYMTKGIMVLVHGDRIPSLPHGGKRPDYVKIPFTGKDILTGVILQFNRQEYFFPFYE